MKEYIEKAIKVTENGYAPYSNFYVGACLVCDDGKTFEGCNIENAAYGPSNCAERTAIFNAISNGYKKFKMIIIVGGPNRKFDNFVTPCGICRQVISEFCDKDFKIVLANSNYDYKEYTIEELLPHSFNL